MTEWYDAVLNVFIEIWSNKMKKIVCYVTDNPESSLSQCISVVDTLLTIAKR